MRWMLLTPFLFAAAFAGIVPADDKPSADEAENARVQAIVEKSVHWYEVFPSADAKEPMKPIVALRWRNATRGQKGEDVLVLWTEAGRPLAYASIFPWQGAICHEFVSVNREAGLIARDGGTEVWSPRKSGVEFRDIPEAPAPAETPAGRLRQMKALAQQFTVTMTGWKSDRSDREELRLLPRPAFRYEIKDAQAADIQDGAMFAFVQGTDPEAMLLLEAVRKDGGLKWQYALSRATSAGLEAKLGDSQVWSLDPQGLTNNAASQPEITLKRSLDRAE